MFLGTALWSSQLEVELPIGLGGFTTYQTLMNSEYRLIYTAVSPWVLRSEGERERTLTNS